MDRRLFIDYLDRTAVPLWFIFLAGLVFLPIWFEPVSVVFVVFFAFILLAGCFVCLRGLADPHVFHVCRALPVSEKTLSATLFWQAVVLPTFVLGSASALGSFNPLFTYQVEGLWRGVAFLTSYCFAVYLASGFLAAVACMRHSRGTVFVGIVLGAGALAIGFSLANALPGSRFAQVGMVCAACALGWVAYRTSSMALGRPVLRGGKEKPGPYTKQSGAIRGRRLWLERTLGNPLGYACPLGFLFGGCLGMAVAAKPLLVGPDAAADESLKALRYGIWAPIFVFSVLFQSLLIWRSALRAFGSLPMSRWRLTMYCIASPIVCILLIEAIIVTACFSVGVFEGVPVVAVLAVCLSWVGFSVGFSACILQWWLSVAGTAAALSGFAIFVMSYYVYGKGGESPAYVAAGGAVLLVFGATWIALLMHFSETPFRIAAVPFREGGGG